MRTNYLTWSVLLVVGAFAKNIASRPVVYDTTSSESENGMEHGRAQSARQAALADLKTAENAADNVVDVSPGPRSKRLMARSRRELPKSDDSYDTWQVAHGLQTSLDTTSAEDSAASSSVVQSGHSKSLGAGPNQKRLRGFQQEGRTHSESKQALKRSSKRLAAADRRERHLTDWRREEDENESSWNGTQDEVNGFGNSYPTSVRNTTRKQRQNQQPSKTYPTKDETLQVLRTVQLLNILLKQQKHHAIEHARPRGASIDPTKLAVSYEDVLARVHRRGNSQVEDNEADTSEEGLSWAAALILAIPPSLLAIILAHHIAKRQSEPGTADGHGDLRSGHVHFSNGIGGFEVESESGYPLDEDILRAEGEAASFGDYAPLRPNIFRRSRRLLKGPTASRALPMVWVHGHPQAELYRTLREPLSQQIEDPFDNLYLDSAYGSGPYASAQPFSHEVTEVDNMRAPAWAGASGNDARGAPDFTMHGGL